MLALTTWLLAATVLPMPMPEPEAWRRIDIDCEAPGALEGALATVERRGPVDIHLHGVCEGNFLIDANGITLRGATPDSGLAAPPGNPTGLPVLEVVDARAALRGMVVRGGEVGVFARGWDAEVLFVGVDVHGQDGVGVYAYRGAWVRLLHARVRDASVGIAAQSDGGMNLQDSVVSNHDVGVIVSEESSAAISRTTIEDNRDVGLGVTDRSDANVIGGVFRENGQAHVSATDWSGVTLLSDVEVGSPADTTPFALGVNRNATIASFTTPVLHGDVSGLVGGSIRLGNTVIDGNLVLVQFADAHVRNATIEGVVFCSDGAQAICRQTTTGGVIDCPSPSCGPAVSDAEAGARPFSAPPALELPRLVRPSQRR